MLVWLLRDEEQKLAYDKTYNFSIEDNLGGNMQIQGKKTDYEKNSSNGSVISKTRDENATLEFGGNNYTYQFSNIYLQFNSGKIQYNRVYDYSSRVYVTGGGNSRSTTFHQLHINATGVKVTFTDAAGVEYEDTIKINIKNVDSDNLKKYTVELINADYERFEIKNLKLYN